MIVGYRLVNEDLTHLGGPMGTEYTEDRWSKNYATVEQAKQAAEKDYDSPIEWVKERNGGWRSPDLGYVMYRIEPITLESET